jgi:hypothetical protein
MLVSTAQVRRARTQVGDSDTDLIERCDGTPVIVVLQDEPEAAHHTTTNTIAMGFHRGEHRSTHQTI